MNADLLALLKSSPSIFRPRDGIMGVKLGEWVSLLNLRHSEETPSAGGWVTICRGLYKGDVGYVSSVENWGKLEVLLLPRLPPLQDGDSSKKRKRGTLRSEPGLFDDEKRDQIIKTHPRVTIVDSKTMGHFAAFGRKFEFFLERRTYGFGSVSCVPVSLQSKMMDLFLCCPHPEIKSARFPCPSEWQFFEGEQVVIKESSKRGIIQSVGIDSAEVELEMGEGLHMVLWSNMWKYIAHGHFAEVISGALQGEKGWVVEVTEEYVYIVERLETQGPQSYISPNSLKVKT
jgi:hypothetical protein